MNSMWKFNYDMAEVTDKSKFLKKNLTELERESSLIICQTLERAICYYDFFDAEVKCQLLVLIKKMQKCNYCRRCCKNASWWDGFTSVVNEFEKMTTIKKMPKSDLETRVAQIVPNYLSANSFLQPPVDMLMVAKHFNDKSIPYIFIDNRIEKLSVEKLYKSIETCKYIIITSTPYDHIQNYFLDYRLKYVFMLVNYIKAQDDRKVIIFCGAHGSVRPDIVFKECGADYVIRGEYDFIVDKVVEKLIKNEKIISKNILEHSSFSKDNLELYSHNVEAYSERKDVMPFYDDIDFANYYGDIYVNGALKKVRNYAAILASRGCMNNCSFCFNFFGNKVRYRSPESVVDEMEYMQARGVKRIFFIDATFTQNKEWTSNICEEIIKRGLKIPWSAETRCDCVDRDLLFLMSVANCDALWFGVESYCDKVLQNNYKYNNNKIGFNAVEICRSNGIQPLQFIMIGAPGESVSSINETIAGLEKLEASYVESAMVATPRFGTKYYEWAKKQYDKLGEDFYSLMGVRGLVKNEMTPQILSQALNRINNREFNKLSLSNG